MHVLIWIPWDKNKLPPKKDMNNVNNCNGSLGQHVVDIIKSDKLQMDTH